MLFFFQWNAKKILFLLGIFSYFLSAVHSDQVQIDQKSLSYTVAVCKEHSYIFSNFHSNFYTPHFENDPKQVWIDMRVSK